MQQPKYKFYATILDAFMNYLNSDIIYNRYWGFSDNPPCSEDEFKEKQFQELINRINRVPFDSEKADKGTAFNEVIDCMIEERKSDIVKIIKIYEEGKIECSAFKPKKKDVVIELMAVYNNRIFRFPMSLCRSFADHFRGALTQQRVEAILPTVFGDVMVYGLIDELMPTTVHDIKTTGSYNVGKFKNHFQHLVYPYALMQKGSDVRTFEYNIVEFNKGGFVAGSYTETYVFKPERDIPILTNHCEEFIRFLEANKALITDKKIFGGQNDE